MVTVTRHGGPARGDLITPTGRLVLYPDELGGEQWLQARRWRNPTDVLTPSEAKRVSPALDSEILKRYGYRIGSSEVPSILDLEGVDTPAHVYRAKVYDIRPEPNEAMNWGHLLEAPIALEWCRRNRAVIDEIGLVANADEPWRQTTIDRRVRECPVYTTATTSGDMPQECLLEVKNVGFASASRWHREIPDRILAQIIDQLDVTGYGHAHYACLVGGNVMKQGIVYAEREVELMEYIRGEVRRFRDKHLLAGVEPDWSEGKADKMIDLDNATYPERDGVAELDIEGVGAAMEYAEIAYGSGGAGEIDKRKKQSAAKLRQVANGAQIGTFGGERVFWYGEGRRTNTDLDMLKERFPQAYEECVTETTFPVLHIDKAYKPRGEK